MTKTCVKCKTEKLRSEFNAYPRNLDGLNSWCKPCILEAGRAYKERNREMVNAKARVQVKAYYWANREKVLAQVKARHAANPYPHRQSSSVHAARRRAAPGVKVDAVDRAYVIERDNSRCHICGKKVAAKDIHLDHLIPISKGGAHTVENLRVAHARCNMSRGAGRIPAQLLLVG